MTGASTYHPAASTPRFDELNGMGITNTINRAELAAIMAAILHCHSHIAIDSVMSLHQIRKHLLYPELQRHHVQGGILRILMPNIHKSPNPVHLFKAKSHAGIAGNECTDAVAKYQATQSTQILQTQGCHALALMATLFMTLPGLHMKGISPLMQHSQGPPTYLPQRSFISQTSMML